MMEITFKNKIVAMRRLNVLIKLLDEKKIAKKLINDFSLILYMLLDRVFSSEGRSTKSGKWKQLSEAYLKAKTKKRPGRTVLVYDGDMRKSLAKGQGNDTEIKKLGKSVEMKWYTPDEKFPFHQKGTDKIPARPIVNMKKDDEKKFMKRLEQYYFKLFSDNKFFDTKL